MHKKVRLRRLAIAFSALLTVLTLCACAALKIVTDIMAVRAEDLARVAQHSRDVGQLAELESRIESWSRVADYIGWGVGTLVLAGSLLIVAGMYHYVFRPLLDVAASMKRFTGGEREVRAKTSAGLELATAADNFNEMADIITGQHTRMLDFLGGAAHELKDPVQVMRVALQEFAPGRALPAESLMRSRLAVLSREVDRLERMVETYLDASNVEWKRLDLQQGRQDLRQLAQQVVRLYETFSSIHRVSLSVPEQAVCVFSDADRLSQVFHTLLTNAIEFSPQGGIVEASVTVEGNEAIVGVTDHGIGISEKDLARIFEPFQKLAAAHQTGPGASVALAVARRIVEAHRGRIEVTSKVGEGSTFRVRLPLAVPLAPGKAPSRPAAEGEVHTGPARRESGPESSMRA
jgi:two-component system, OmpR family, sensor histidine kinase MtrB